MISMESLGPESLKNCLGIIPIPQGRTVSLQPQVAGASRGFARFSAIIGYLSRLRFSYFPAMVRGKDQGQGEFAKNLFSALTKTFIWSIGEVNLEKLEDVNEAYDIMSKFIFLTFLFLFVIVMMNLLNAIGIGDIKVHCLI